ncbi:hypothetical protein V9T40_010104 [Parthenolecanium corni]|uniref:Uncharacterized protein n=1 Tax=Parthenolecanium corni TaxID=536013 RepID=A0AAN9TZ21_9HEMI
MCLLMVLGLLMAGDIQFTLCSPTKEHTINNAADSSIGLTNINIGEAVSAGLSSLGDGKPKIVKSVRNGRGQKSLDFLTSANQKKLINKPLTTLHRVASPINIEEMKKKLAAYRVEAIKNAKSEFEKVTTKVKNLQLKSVHMKRTEALKMIEEQRKNARSVKIAINEEALKKLTEAKKSIKEKYNQAVLAANEKLKKAPTKRRVASEAAVNKFKKIRNDIEHDRQKVESEHAEAVKRGRQQREAAVKSAKSRMSKARDTYTRRMASKKKISSEARKKLEKEFQEEKNKFKQSLESAKNKWQELLNTLGIGEQIRQCDEAIKKAEKELYLALDKIDPIYKGAFKEHEKVIQKAKQKKREAEKLAEGENRKVQKAVEDEYQKAMQTIKEAKSELA